MTKFPDNICFVMEGQDHSSMKADETKLWCEKFHHNTKRYITNVIWSGPQAGMLITRLCHVPDSGKIKVKLSYSEGDLDIFLAPDFSRAVEIFFFLEFRYIKRAGRREKAHIGLRRDFMEAYEPSGVMGHEEMLMWVDCGVLNSGDIEAEYIGCYDATSFLAYDHHPDFKSTTDRSKLQGRIRRAQQSYQGDGYQRQK